MPGERDGAPAADQAIQKRRDMRRQPPRKPSSPVNRKQDMLNAAAHLFSTRGFDGSSMRMIARMANVRAASLYYHFPSKAEMLAAVYEESGRKISAFVLAAIEGETDPWRRLELACCAHLRALLAGIDYIQVTFSESPRRFPPGLRDRLIAERDRYERIFRDLVDAIPMKDARTRKYFMLSLFGAAAWTRMWYRAGGDEPETIARNILAIVRSGVETSPVAERRRRLATVRR